jgi:hypothetical protein
MSESNAERKVFKPRNKLREVIHPTSRNNISVGCKLPNGMHLDITGAGESLQRITLKGINSLTEGAIIRPATRKGFAITENVPKEFFDEWMRTHSNHPAVKNHLIFAHTQTASVRDMAEDFKELEHGFEPIDPNKPAKGIETRKDED